MKFGLIGEHLKHSFSKEIHESLMDDFYDLKELEKDEVANFLRERNFKGINVTIPYKETVIPYLDEIDEAAKNIGAVNTIVNINNKLKGYNTDYFGFVELVRHAHIEIKDRNCLILGSGGVSKAIKVALNNLGAKNIYIASINGEEGTITYGDIKKINDINVLVNATPVGMYPNNEGLIYDISSLDKLEGILDVIYNPINTRLILEAKKRGLKAEGGLYMLVGQAIRANELFLNRKIDDEVIEKIYQKILKRNSNIVLMGMPSCGKSSIGKLLSEELNLPLIETDEEIVKRINMPIKVYKLVLYVS